MYYDVISGNGKLIYKRNSRISFRFNELIFFLIEDLPTERWDHEGNKDVY